MNLLFPMDYRDSFNISFYEQVEMLRKLPYLEFDAVIEDLIFYHTQRSYRGDEDENDYIVELKLLQ